MLVEPVIVDLDQRKRLVEFEAFRWKFEDLLWPILEGKTYAPKGGLEDFDSKSLPSTKFKPPEKLPKPNGCRESSLPTTIFQGRTVKLRGWTVQISS